MSLEEKQKTKKQGPRDSSLATKDTEGHKFSPHAECDPIALPFGVTRPNRPSGKQHHHRWLSQRRRDSRTSNVLHAVDLGSTFWSKYIWYPKQPKIIPEFTAWTKPQNQKEEKKQVRWEQGRGQAQEKCAKAKDHNVLGRNRK